MGVLAAAVRTFRAAVSTERKSLELTIIGSASAEPNPGSASSCYLIDGGHGQLVLECGHGASSKLFLHTSIEKVGAILISHMHPDHFFDIVPIKYHISFNRHPKMRLIIPPTGPTVLEGIAGALGERKSFWTSAFEIEVFDPERGLDLLGFRISMTPTHHYIPAWAMRIGDQNGSAGALAYTSDTSFTPAIVDLAHGADILLAEASIEHQTKPEHDQGHLTAEDAGRIAEEAGVGRLVITHYPSAKAEHMIKVAKGVFSGPAELACEGAQYQIP